VATDAWKLAHRESRALYSRINIFDPQGHLTHLTFSSRLDLPLSLHSPH
jgi:hypothetical protein